VDLYLYEQLGSGFSVRVSGNLGNQVGRGNVEGFGTASVREAILGQDLRAALGRRPKASWLIPRIHSDGFAESIFEQDLPYSSLANYMLGSSFALQLTPYADARVIMLAKKFMLRNPCFRGITEGDLRKRDLLYRLFGPPRGQSFQRAFLKKHDVIGSQIPLNWGWHVNGEWSWRSRMPPLCYIADAFILKLARTNGFAAPLAGISRYLGHPSAFVHWPDVLRDVLKPIVYDVLLSQKLRESGLFDCRALSGALNDHFRGRVNHHVAICRALEIGLGLAGGLQVRREIGGGCVSVAREGDLLTRSRG